MENVRHIELGIAEKLKNDESYRKAFFRAFTTDNIALQIRKLRNVRGFNQAEFASVAGMKQSAVSRIEQAEYSSWTLTTLLRIADALNARIKVTFELAEEVIMEYEPVKPVDSFHPTCYRCGAPLVGDGAYWVCPEHGRDCVTVPHFACWDKR